MKQPTPKQESYEAPRIEHKGQLKQFAGSPLGGKPDSADPLDLLN